MHRKKEGEREREGRERERERRWEERGEERREKERERDFLDDNGGMSMSVYIVNNIPFIFPCTPNSNAMRSL